MKEREGGGKSREGTVSDHLDKGGEFILSDEELWKVLKQRGGGYLIRILMVDQRCGRNGE